MLLRSRKTWCLDFFLRRGWLVERRRFGRRDRAGRQRSVVAAECQRLEERVLLSTITVNSLNDDGPSNTGTNLRDALAESQNGDVIALQAGMSGTFNLDPALGPLQISSSVRINGLGVGASGTTITGGGQSKIFSISNDAGNNPVDVTLDGLTLLGKSTQDGTPVSSTAGGAIEDFSTGTLTVKNSKITGNSSALRGGAIYAYGLQFNTTAAIVLTSTVFTKNYTTGDKGYGGAIYANRADLTITNCTFSGNFTQGSHAGGGAIGATGTLTVMNSTLTGNSTAGTFAPGGGIFAPGAAPHVSVSNSKLYTNSTKNDYSPGGAIYTGFEALTVTNSALWNNSTAGKNSYGGGIDCGNLNTTSAHLTVTNSTVTGNSTTGTKSDGGGICVYGPVTMTNCTVAINHANGATGGGIREGTADAILLRNTILAKNTDATPATAPDLDPGTSTSITALNILIGDNKGSKLASAPVGMPDAHGNLIGTHSVPIDPQLGPRTGNGGPTPTMALLAGSPAINAGSNAQATNPGPDHIAGNADDVALTTDQRGGQFARIAGGTVDIGAYEIQSHVPALPTVVALTTKTSLPVLAGTWDQTQAIVLQVTVNGTTYTLGDSHLTSDSAGNWTLHTSVTIPDGTYNVSVHTANDIGENADKNATNVLTVDTDTPSAPTVTALITNNPTPTITGTFAAESTVLTVTVAGSTYTLGTSSQLTAQGTGWTLNLSGTTALSDGPYDVAVHTADIAGNSSDLAATNALTVDTDTPTAPTVNSVVTNNKTPTINGTFAAESTVLTVTVSGTTYTLGTSSQLTALGTDWLLNLAGTTALSDGQYNITVHTADVAGNNSDLTATGALTIDTDTPTAPTVNLLVTNNKTPTITGTFAAESTVLTVTVNGTTYTQGTSSQLTVQNTGWTLNLAGTTALSDGPYNVTVHTADAAGNNSDLTATNALTIDTDTPMAPTVNSLVTNKKTPTVTGSFAVESVILTVTVNGTTYTLGSSSQLTAQGTGWMLNLAGTTALSDGLYDVAVHTADAAGNNSDVTAGGALTIDTDTPNAPTATAPVTNNPTPTITGTFAGEAIVLSVTLNSTTYTLGTSSQLTAQGTGWTLNLGGTTALSDGPYDVAVHTADAAGNNSDVTATGALTIDTDTPTAPTVNSLVTNNKTPTITGTFAAEAIVLTVTVNSTTYTLGASSQLTAQNTGWTLNLAGTTALSDGLYDVAVHAADPAGNDSDVTAGGALTIDTDTPNAPTVTALVTNDPTPTITGTLAAEAIVLTVTVNGTTYTLGSSSQLTAQNTGWTLNLAGATALSDGLYKIAVHTTDAAGNSSDLAATNALIVNTVAPASTSFTGEYTVATQDSNTRSLASVTQNGTTLTLQGTTAATATVVSTTQLQIGGVNAVYGDGVITFGATGTFANQVWTKLDLPADYTNPAGALVHVAQNGTGVTFTDRNGAPSPGTWMLDPVSNALELSGYGETVTVGSGTSIGELVWHDGTVWSEVVNLVGTNSGTGTTSIHAVPSKVLVTDYLLPSGETVHTAQTGTKNIVFIDKSGSMVLGTYSDSSTNVPQATAPGYPGYTASIVGNTITWTDGNPAHTRVWTQTSHPASTITVTDFTNQKGVPVHLVENGVSQNGVVHFVIVDGMGNTSLGHFQTATTGVADSYPTDIATFSGNTQNVTRKLVWSDGVFVWTQTDNPPLLISSFDAGGKLSHLKLLTATTLIGLDGPMQGVTGTRLNGKIFWLNGQVWDNLDFNALNAFFETGTGFP
jgi:hypothetical protein